MDLLEVRALQPASLADGVHGHGAGQLFAIHSGVLGMTAGARRWMMPAGFIGWIPPQLPHGALLRQQVQGLSLYFAADWSHARMPATVTVVRCSPLLAALLHECTQMADPLRRAPYLALLADAFCHQMPQPFCVPLPTDARLLAVGARLLRTPDSRHDIDYWAASVHMSRRSFVRHCQRELGQGFAAWRQQLRLQLALQQLAAGTAVTTVALNVGYHSVSAFIQVFRRHFGVTPAAMFATAALPG